MATRRLLPLLLASDRFRREDEPEPLDRIRMQKGVFLLSQRGRADWQRLYRYTPYDWGPYSGSLADDLDDLVAKGLMEYERIPGRRYGRYRTTAEGEKVVDQFNIDEKALRFVGKVRLFVTERSFTRLLKDVYKAFPEYAVRSRFKG